MTRQLVLRGAGSMSRRQRLLNSKSTSSTTSLASLGEVVGGTAAECAAIGCCCPFGLMEFFVLLAYKVPAGLCRRALRTKRRQRLIKMGLLNPQGSRLSLRIDDREEGLVHPVTLSELMEANKPRREVEMEVAQIEKEMWERFYGAGFWRSRSQKSIEYTVA